MQLKIVLSFLNICNRLPVNHLALILFFSYDKVMIFYYVIVIQQLKIFKKRFVSRVGSLNIKWQTLLEQKNIHTYVGIHM
jgi:hypothetical protein